MNSIRLIVKGCKKLMLSYWKNPNWLEIFSKYFPYLPDRFLSCEVFSILTIVICKSLDFFASLLLVFCAKIVPKGIKEGVAPPGGVGGNFSGGGSQKF